MGACCIGFSMGQGRKAANMFAENQTLFATNRAIDLRQNGGTIYGLRPEKAWNYGGVFSKDLPSLVNKEN